MWLKQSIFSHKIKVSCADYPPCPGSFCVLQLPMPQGDNYLQVHFLQFWLKHTLHGIYMFICGNGTGSTDPNAQLANVCEYKSLCLRANQQNIKH